MSRSLAVGRRFLGHQPRRPRLPGHCVRRRPAFAKRSGEQWHACGLLPRIGPPASLCIVIAITTVIVVGGGDVVNLPLAAPTAIAWIVHFLTALASTAASNNFGLAASVHFAAVAGRLVEVQLLIALVPVAAWQGRRQLPESAPGQTGQVRHSA